MRILITGGCGFIGSHVANALAKNHDVLVIDDLSSGLEKNIEMSSIQLKKIDICDFNTLLSAFEDFSPELVIHLAAHIKVRESLEKPSINAQTNIIGTINVVEACKKHSVGRLIYTSTGGARYGDPKQLPVAETHPASPLSPYAISKYSAEYYVKIAGEQGISSLILCFGNVYGPKDYPESKHIVPIVIDKFLNEESPTIFGDGNQTRDFLFVEDIVQVIQNNLTTTEGLYNLASGEKISINTLCELIRNCLNSSVSVTHEAAIKGEVRDIELDVTKAKTDLGFVPTEISEGIKKTIDWFKKK